MCLKIRCDGESENFLQNFWGTNRALLRSTYAAGEGQAHVRLLRTAM
jgi:hypothetical protein